MVAHIQMIVPSETLRAAFNPDAGVIKHELGSWNREITICTGCGMSEDGWSEDISNHKDDCSYVAKNVAIQKLRELLEENDKTQSPKKRDGVFGYMDDQVQEFMQKMVAMSKDQ